jgi:hypothetical protein
MDRLIVIAMDRLIDRLRLMTALMPTVTVMAMVMV